jgi:hypothetical protein
VNVGSVYSITHERLRGASIDLHIASSDCFQYCPSVVRGLIERSIAMDSAYTEQLDLWIVRAEEEGIGILE